MTKSERSDLLQIVRKREKVLKTMANERATALLADSERQLSAIYSFDQDATWAKAKEQAEAVVHEANAAIAERSKALGIPRTFAPRLGLDWYHRGENMARDRRAELRKVAQSRVEAMLCKARSEIEKVSLTAQTEIATHGLESDAARQFLENMPGLETMMPALSTDELKRLCEFATPTDDE